MQEKILYLECYSGISGDMMVGALLDLGANQEVLEKALSSLHLEGFQIQIKEVIKSNIRACDFHVILDEQHENYDHDCEYLYSQSPQITHKHSHTHHNHRNLSDILHLISHSNLTDNAKKIASHIFEIIACAEADAHGLPVEEVHFHEVGAVDSIVDIVAAAVCLDNLNIKEVIASELYEGKGQVRCQHGMLPIPVPAVSYIMSAYHLPIRIMDKEGEFVTPTGAAIIAAIRTKKQLPEKFNIQKTGIGSGKRDYPQSSILRAMIIEEEIPTKDFIWILQTNIDDCTGETLGFTIEQLFCHGALDAYYTPIYMKKNRPAYLLNVICEQTKIKDLEQIIFVHTTTIGIRKYQVERTTLNRKIKTISTPFGSALVKLCEFEKNIYCYPEAESVKQIALEQKISFSEAYHIIKTAASNLS